MCVQKVTSNLTEKIVRVEAWKAGCQEMGVGIGKGEGPSAQRCLLEKLGGSLYKKYVCVLLEF